MKPFKLLLVTIASMLLVSACGQRGPLFIPKPPAPLEKPAGYDEQDTQKPAK